MSDTNTLVAKLADPSFEHVFQKHDNGHTTTRTVEVPALLEQMRERVWPSSGADSGSKAMKSTRAVADLDAMFEYAKITAQITDWCHMAGITVAPKDTGEALKAWWKRAAHLLTDEQHAWYHRQLAGWVHLIEDHIDGPEKFTIEHPCPSCHTTGWGDQINGGDRYPIQVRYRLDGDGAMQDEVARCRTCGLVWRGHDAILELGDELNEKHAANE